MKGSQFNVNNQLFTGERVQSIAIVSFKEKPIRHTADLSYKEIFFNYLDFISTHKKIKVILFLGPPLKMRRDEYSSFYKNLSNLRIPTLGMDAEIIERFYNAINQFILKMVACDKIVIAADSGETPLIYLGASLAYDYRIIADNTVFSNPNLELGVIQNGGITYFLSNIVGRKKAFDILMNDKEITAADALKLGIVDKVVPLGELKESALTIAQKYAEKASSYSSGIKRLLNYDTNRLRNVLEYENEIIRFGIRDG